MSGAVTAAVVVGAAAIGSAVYSGEQQRKAADKQRKAQEQAALKAEQTAKTQMERQEKQQEQEINRMNRRNQANAGAAVDGSLASLDGPGSTLLTGAQGISPDQLQLGKNTLLGG